MIQAQLKSVSDIRLLVLTGVTHLDGQCCLSYPSITQHHQFVQCHLPRHSGLITIADASLKGLSNSSRQKRKMMGFVFEGGEKRVESGHRTTKRESSNKVS